ncbi:hypothetical protein NEOKW01_0701 [Nematocida sp. AWRm80]|nr:hypothetical protein NEOKW01_0701 [Nematocida sp. AWRm80]
MKERKKAIAASLKRREIEEALTKCKEYLQYDDDDSKVYLWMGYCHAQLNNYSLALQAYNQAKQCTDHQETEKEVIYGIANLYTATNKYGDKFRTEKEIEIQGLEAAINQAEIDNKQEHLKRYILYILECYRYDNLDKYFLLVKEKVFNSHKGTNSLNLEETKVLEILQDCTKEHLRQFTNQVKRMIEEQRFIQPRPQVQKELTAIIHQTKESLEEYTNYLFRHLEEKQEPNTFLSDIFDRYLFYLIMYTYTDYKGIIQLSKIVSIGVSKSISLEGSKYLLLLLLADYLDVSSTICKLEEFKKVSYNTLSPTVMFLRDPSNLEECYRFYQELSTLTGVEYRNKKEYIIGYMYRPRVSTGGETGIKYTAEKDLREIEEKYLQIKNKTSQLILIKPLLRTGNYHAIKNILSRRESETEETIERVSQLNIRPLTIGTTEKENIIEIAINQLYNTLVPHFTELQNLSTIQKINEYYYDVINCHISILNNQVQKAYEYIRDNHTNIDILRVSVLHTNRYDKYLYITKRMESMYLYAQFVTRYINSIIRAHEKEIVIEHRYPSIIQDNYISLFSNRYLRQLTLPEDTTVLEVLVYTANTSNTLQKHLLGYQNYEKGNIQIGLHLLEEALEEYPQNYQLVCDLSQLLANHLRYRNKAQYIINEYLREKEYQNDRHLLGISLELSRVNKNWQMVEKSAKELLLSEYSYKVKMALVESLSNQTKQNYALVVLQEILQEETDTTNIYSAEVYSIYLHLQTERLTGLDEKINTLLRTIPHQTGYSKILQQYKEYLYAKEIKEAITIKGPKYTEQLLDKYQQTIKEKEYKDSTLTSNQSTYLDSIIDNIQVYLSIVSYLLQGISIPKSISVRRVSLEYVSMQERQMYLITQSKLFLLLASITGTLDSPEVHQQVSYLLKKANSEGKTKEALEVEVVLRYIRGEDISIFYKEETAPEKTPAMTLILSLLKDSPLLGVYSREYLKHTTILDAPLIFILLRRLLGRKSPKDREDVEAAYLHLCRRYSTEGKELCDFYKEINK